MLQPSRRQHIDGLVGALGLFSSPSGGRPATASEVIIGPASRAPTGRSGRAKLVDLMAAAEPPRPPPSEKEATNELNAQRQRSRRLSESISASAAARAASQLADNEGHEQLQLALLKLAPAVGASVKVVLKQIDARSFKHGQRLRAAAYELEGLSLSESEAHLMQLDALATRLIAEREALLSCALRDIHVAESDGERSIKTLEARVRALQVDGQRKAESLRSLQGVLDETHRRLCDERILSQAESRRGATEVTLLREEATAMEARLMAQSRELKESVAARRSCWMMANEIETLRRQLAHEATMRQRESEAYRREAEAMAAAAREERRRAAAELSACKAERKASCADLALALEQARLSSDRFEAALRVAATDRWESLVRTNRSNSRSARGSAVWGAAGSSSLLRAGSHVVWSAPPSGSLVASGSSAEAAAALRRSTSSLMTRTSSIDTITARAGLVDGASQ